VWSRIFAGKVLNMARIATINRPEDYPGKPDVTVKEGLAALFAQLFPDQPARAIDPSHAGIALAAHNPHLAMKLADLSKFIALDMPWCGHADLRELAIAVVNRHFHCDYAYQARIPHILAAEIGQEQLDLLANHGDLAGFNEDQQLVIGFARASVAGRVDDALFAELVARFGEKQAMECSIAVAWWSFWAQFLQATGAEFMK
jgi:alkylhydroperoxidase family enzyme